MCLINLELGSAITAAVHPLKPTPMQKKSCSSQSTDETEMGFILGRT